MSSNSWNWVYLSISIVCNNRVTSLSKQKAPSSRDETSEKASQVKENSPRDDFVENEKERKKQQHNIQITHPKEEN